MQPVSLDGEQRLVSPVGFGWKTQDGRVGLADEVLIGHFADHGRPFFPARQGLQGQGGLYFGPQHAQVRGQHVDEDLRGKGWGQSYFLVCCEYR